MFYCILSVGLRRHVTGVGDALGVAAGEEAVGGSKGEEKGGARKGAPVSEATAAQGQAGATVMGEFTFKLKKGSA